jgi:hypothetical protein
MGVLACDRAGCDNILCEYYSRSYGYLCYECVEELAKSGMQDVGAFMCSPKRSINTSEAWEDFVYSEFKRRD